MSSTTAAAEPLPGRGGQTPLFPLSAFNLPPNVTHVCAAGESAPLIAHADAAQAYLSHKAHGMAGRAAPGTGIDAQIDAVRDLVATAWSSEGVKGDTPEGEKVTRGDIGFVSSVAEGVGLVLESLSLSSEDWQPGDNIVLDAEEFPSVAAPFILRAQGAAARGGPELRYYASSTGQQPADIIDARTRLVAVSYVSFLHGARVDVRGTRAAIDAINNNNNNNNPPRRKPCLLLLDVTQAAGILPLSPVIPLADFAFSSCYKFLLATTGVALAYWNRSRYPSWPGPASAGWHSLGNEERGARPSWGAFTSSSSSSSSSTSVVPAEQQKQQPKLNLRPDAMVFCRGNPAHLPLYLLRTSLEFLSQYPAPAIAGHVQALTVALIRGLEDEHNIPCATPQDPSRHGPNVVVNCRGSAEICQAMAAAQDRTEAHRGETGPIYAWSGMGRVRFSFHGYNSRADVHRILALFPGLWRRYNDA